MQLTVSIVQFDRALMIYRRVLFSDLSYLAIQQELGSFASPNAKLKALQK